MLLREVIFEKPKVSVFTLLYPTPYALFTRKNFFKCKHTTNFILGLILYKFEVEIKRKVYNNESNPLNTPFSKFFPKFYIQLLLIFLGKLIYIFFKNIDIYIYKLLEEWYFELPTDINHIKSINYLVQQLLVL